MSLTLLLDLDDTLLSNQIDAFLKGYLKALGKHLIDYVAPEVMVQSLLAATQVMIANNNPRLNLERAFDQFFYPAIGRSKEEMRPQIDQFYQEVFPVLQGLTNHRPEAVRLVDYAIQHGHTLVIATNPVFPRPAILHRLRWAGLPPETTPFALISDYQRFHFAKPNPAFLAEALAQVGWPNQPAVMVGNSLEEDLYPAAQLGLPVYWVTETPAALPDGFHPISASGDLSAVPAWLEQVDQAGLRMEFTSPAALLALLKSTPAAFDTLSLDLTERQWQERPAPKEWSLTEIFCHLRDVDREVNIPRIQKVLAEDSPFVAGINTDPWAEERDYLHEDGRAALRDFIEQRSQLIELLEKLPPEGWERSARHAIFGPTTIRELISFITTHDCSHIQQGQAAAQALV